MQRKLRLPFILATVLGTVAFLGFSVFARQEKAENKTATPLRPEPAPAGKERREKAARQAGSRKAAKAPVKLGRTSKKGAKGRPADGAESQTVVLPMQYHGISDSLANLAARNLPPVSKENGPVQEEETEELFEEPTRNVPSPPALVQTQVTAPLAAIAGTSFEGPGLGLSGFTVSSAPPDTTMAVGPNHIVAWVNSRYAVFNKSGALLLGPVNGNTLFTGVGGNCETTNRGDPILQYDRLADRWLLSQFAFSSGTTAPFLQCFAVSTTNDPTGTYYRYTATFTDFNDYGKLGIWNDAYYTAYNMFTGSPLTNNGVALCASDRTKMLAGDPTATTLCAPTAFYAGGGSFLPADLDGLDLPSDLTRGGLFMRQNTAPALQYLRLKPDFTAGTVTLTNGFGGASGTPVSISIPAFTRACNGTGGQCIPQPGTTQTLDTLGGRLMYRLAFRNRGGVESMVVAQTGDPDGATTTRVAAMQWWEIRNPLGNPSDTDTSKRPFLYQSGLYDPGASGARWMGSVAMNKYGDIFAGYSLTTTTLKPSIAVAGRAQSDTLGTLQAEQIAVTGTGSQTTTLARWGDYATMQVDPADDATFWYTTEYLAADGTFNWRTRILSYKFPETTATTDGDFNNAANWSNGIPNGLISGTIPTGRTLTVNATSTVGNLVVANGANLVMNANLNVTGSLTLGTIVNTGTSTLGLGCQATVSGASATSYVRGNVKKDYCSTGGFTYPTGTANGYSPVSVNITTLTTNPSSLTVQAVQGYHPNLGLPNNRLQRYWTLTEAGDLTANLQFNYLASDVTGANESTFNVYKIESGTVTNIGGTINATAHTASVTGITNFSDWTAGDPTAPTLATVNEYQAYQFPDGNLIRWRSERETRNLGFNVYRQEGRRRVLVTPDLVAGSALRFGAETNLTAGNSYSWWDAKGTAESVYWIEDIDLNSTRTVHGPITLTRADAGSPLAQSQASALLSQMRPTSTGNGVTVRQALSNATANVAPAPGSDAWQQQINLAGRTALKLTVRQAGWYRLTGAQIPRSVIAPNAEVRFLRLYRNGQEQPIIAKSEGGRDTGPLGDTGYLEFYGTGTNLRETDSNTYWLVLDTVPGLRIAPPVRVVPGGGGDIDGNGPAASNGKGQDKGQPAEGETPRLASAAAPSPGGGADSFPYTVEREENTIYFPALLNGEETENFFGAVINNVALNQVLPVSQLATGAGTLEVALQGASQTPHSVQVQLNGQTLGTVSYTNRANKVQRLTVPAGLLTEGDNTVTLLATGGSDDVSLVDKLRLTYPHRYAADNNQLRFTTAGQAGLRVTGFSSNRVRVFDITDPTHILELATNTSSEVNGYTVTIAGQVARRTLYAVAEGQMLTPASLTPNAPSSWTQTTRRADFLIVTHQNFRAAVEPLAALRRSQGLETEVVTVEDIYDEWNGGEKSTQAIRGFLLWARANWQLAPRYVLLVGDATYDPRNYTGLGSHDYLPTAYAETELMETASDESLGDSNQDGIGEMAFGRLPVRTLEQAQLMVNKVLSYQVPADSRGALLVSDRPEGYDFVAMNQAVRELLPVTMPVTQVNRAALTDAEARQQIIQGFNNGPALVNYNGHGSVEVWVGAGLLRSTDAGLMTNSERLPVVYAMTCLNGFFQDTATDALAEALMKASGGAVAVWSSSGLTVATGQTQINQAFMRYIYREASAPRLGDAVRAAKGATPDLEVRKTWILLGDPTLVLH